MLVFNMLTEIVIVKTKGMIKILTRCVIKLHVSKSMFRLIEEVIRKRPRFR